MSGISCMGIKVIVEEKKKVGGNNENSGVFLNSNEHGTTLSSWPQHSDQVNSALHCLFQ